jgi:trehalose 6-phosphate synthase
MAVPRSRRSRSNEDAEITRALRELTSEMFAERNLIIASNRGPLEYDMGEHGELVAGRGSGGVVTALNAVSQFANLTWVASAMTEGDRRAADLAEAKPLRVEQDGGALNVRFVVSARNTYNRYYNIFCNPLLWFVQHYMWNTPRTPNISRTIYDSWDQGYVPVNRQFGEAIATIAASGAQSPYVMLHDYHLYLAPGEVRTLIPEAVIHHFTHIPWPDPRYWELLPLFMRRAIHQSLCRADIVGMQTLRDTRNFLHSSEAFLDGAEVDYRDSTVRYNGRLTYVRAYPISIDAHALLEFAASPEVEGYRRMLRSHWGEKTIVRVDRAEPSKNILRGFRAYELLIQRHEEFRGRVKFVAFLVPSRTDIGVYQTYTDEIFELVDAINDEYGVPGWQPIEVFYESNYAQAIAALRDADVTLVNPLIDGMNLVAKEVSLVNDVDGVLVLSEAAGSYDQLREYVLEVGPADIEGTVRALRHALRMGALERRRRARGLRRLVEEEDVRLWLMRQFRDMQAIG